MTSLRLLAVLNVLSSTPARAKRLAPRPDGPLAHFASPSDEKSRLMGFEDDAGFEAVAATAISPSVSWQERLRIVLVQPRNPLNIGAAARAMLNFGFSNLWLVDPYEKAFREARSAAGAAEVLRQAQVSPHLPEALGDASLVVGTSAMRGRAEDHVQRLLPAGALPLRTHLADRTAALLFGSEKFGLSNDHLSHCDWILTIPTEEGCPSMNLGQAVALCCYELARHSRTVPGLKTPASIGADERDRIIQMLVPMLEAGGFILPENRDAQLRKLRRWVSRLRLAPKDARMFQGMLRQIQWKLDNP